MHLSSVRLQRFRAVTELSFAPGGGLTLIVGENAQGKTTVLEAIHYLSTGRSFRTRNDRECIPLSGASGTVARVEGEVILHGGPSTRTLSINSEGKFLWVNDKPVDAISELLGSMPSVVVAASDLDIVRGAPERRRSFMDSLIAQTDSAAFTAMRDYAAALRGRNGILRRANAASKSELAAFEAVMADSAARLVAVRREAAAAISVDAAREVAAATCGLEEFAVEYEPGSRTECRNPEQFRSMWEADRPQDLERAHTSRGPHRDDYSLHVAGLDARKFASQGQCRTAALALRLAGAEYIAARLGHAPILLLDDVLGELDKKRATVFLTELARRDTQSILTTTDAAPILEVGIRAEARFRLAGGMLEAL